MTNLENAFVWLYVKTWGKFGDRVITEMNVSCFGAQDLETAIMQLAYPRKKEQTERVEALIDLIAEKFGQDRSAFREWSAKIHREFIETLPETVETSNQVTKILKWDQGKYLLKSLSKYISTDNLRSRFRV